MNHIEIFSLAERWKLLRDDFAIYDRDDPNTTLRLLDADAPDEAKPPRIHSSCFAVDSGLIDHNRISWIFLRAALLFEISTAGKVLEDTDAFICAPWYSDLWNCESSEPSIRTVSEFTIRLDRETLARTPTDRWVHFLIWFRTGSITPVIINHSMRVCRDACSFIADEIFRRIGEGPHSNITLGTDSL